MVKYDITGMSCAACSARVEKAVSKVPGVDSVAVSLLTNEMGVEGSASESDIIKAVVNAGYGASRKSSAGVKQTVASDDSILKDTQTPKIRNRFIVSLVFLLILMYFSMGHMMFGFPVSKFLENNHIAMGLVQMILAIIIMVINQKFFISGFKSLFHLAPNMDTLVALGSSASFLYSLAALFAMTDAQIKGNSDAVMKYMHEFYFESAAMILTLITLGKMLESYSKGKTTDALKSLIKLSPKTALIEKGGIEKTVPVEQVIPGDILIVKPGDKIPVDGVVLEGTSAVNESALTGESIPVDKKAGDKVSSATINTSGYMKCRAEKVGSDTALSKIIEMVSDAAATKAPIAKTADKISGIFVPSVIALALITFIVWLFVGTQTVGYSLARAVSVLVISCPCALGLATPVAIMVGNGIGAKHGILFKTAASLEEAGRIQIAALDKTGTITKGEPMVVDICPAEGITKTELLQKAYSLEIKSEHPLAKAIVNYAKENSLKPFDSKNFEAVPGKGLKAEIDGKIISGGNASYILNEDNENTRITINKLSDEGKTPLLFSESGKYIGTIAVADVIKEDSAKAIKELQNMGIRVAMLTGDNARTAAAIGKQAGVDKVFSGVMPGQKETIIKEMMKCGKVAMVGDGINDAPALTRANLGIAIGAGTDVAIDAADVVLVKSRLSDVSAAIRLGRKTLKNIHENLFWAFFYNVIGIPLAAGVYIPLFGWTLNPMFGAAAMSLSSFCVVTNALRLNLFNIKSAKRDKKIKNIAKIPEIPKFSNNGSKINEKDVTIMTKTIKIEGMMCAHCEATVKKALEALEGVNSADVSHEKGTAVVDMSKDVDNTALKKAVEDKDYKVLAIA